MYELDFDEALPLYLKSLVGIKAVVNDRVYRAKLPKNVVYPAVRITQISRPKKAKDLALETPRYQFSCFGKTFEDARKAADQIRSAFEGIHGQIGDLYAFYTELDGESEGFEEDTELHHISVDVIFHH